MGDARRISTSSDFSKMRFLASILGLTALFLSVNGNAETTTVVLNSVADATIFSENDNANGAGDITVGRTAGTGGHGWRRGLIRFDLSSIPADAEILSVSLGLRISKFANSGSFEDSAVNRLTAPWTEGRNIATGEGTEPEEGDVTYNFATYDTVPWAVAGGDFVETPSGLGSDTFVDNRVIYTGEGMIDDVVSWLTAPETNFGWIIRKGEDQPKTTVHYVSREALFEPSRPQLTIEYKGGTVIEPVSVDLPPSRDATIFLESENASGAGDLRFGQTNNGGRVRRSLIAFDLSGIPQGARIDEASVTMTVTQRGGSGVFDVSLYELLGDWGEGPNSGGGEGVDAVLGDVTNSYRFFDTEEWGNAGGDFLPTAAATTTVTEATAADSDLVFAGPELIASLQDAVNHAEAHEGFIIIGDEVTAGTTVHLASREHETEENRPVLNLTYTPEATSLYGGYEIVNEAGDVNTGSLLGWINVAEKPWIWSYTFLHYLYMPENWMGPAGSWSYMPVVLDLSNPAPEDNTRLFGWTADLNFDLDTTDAFLDWANTEDKPKVYLYSTSNWAYIDESFADGGGTYIYFYR